MAKSPSHGRDMGGLYLICWRRNYPQDTGTYMDPLALSRGSRMDQHASGQMQSYIRPRGEDASGLRALMQSALPLLITTTASGALYLRRLGGSRSDLSCHQFDHTSHCAEGLLELSIKSKYCSNTC